MEVGIVDREKLVNIADAVRKKTGIIFDMTLDDIASNITSMSPASDNNAKFDFSGSGSESELSLLSYLTTVDLSGWDTSNFFDMSYMFKDCSSLTSLDLSGFKTSEVGYMSEMFFGCSSLTSLDLSNWNTSNVHMMDAMFSGCKSLTSLNLSNWNTSRVTNMLNMFNSCYSLTSLDVSGFDTSMVDNMGNMFNSCSSLTSLDVSNFDTSNATNILGMFEGCSSLTSLDVSGFNTSNATSLSHMFNGCSSLTSLNLSNWNTSNVTSMMSMFQNCSYLTSLDLSNFDTSKVNWMNLMFNSCTSLTSLDLSNFNTSKVSDMKGMFEYCSKLFNLTLGNNWASNSSIKSFDLSSCPLTRESAVDVINKLATRSNSPVIKFSNAVGLYQSEIDIATNKGWSVSGCGVLVDAESATVGQYALIDGVVSKCVYVADTPQDWGQKIFASQPYVIYSNNKSTFQWGGYGTATGITATAIGTGLANTNSLLAMNLQSTDGTPTIWDALKEFRSKYGDRWFIPSLEESSLYIGYVYWTSSEVTSQSAYTRNTSVTADSANKTSINHVYPFTYV